MKKAAFFVEGQTEQLFVHRLLTEAAGSKQLTVHACQARGRAAARAREFHAAKPGGDYFALVVDCGADNAVVSDVRESYDSLVRAGYTAIVGVRDVFPSRRADIPLMEAAQYFRIKTRPFRPVLILAVMEIESWFIGEETHFQRVDPRLTFGEISASCGFDPSTSDPQLRDNPAADLHAIYSIVGQSYTKRKAEVQRTIDALDCAHLYFTVSSRIFGLGALVSAVDAFLT